MDQPEINPDLVAAVRAQPRADTGRTRGGGVAAAVIAVLVLIGAGVVYYFNSPTHKAEQACKAYVLDRLTSPSTAKFSDVQFFDTSDPEVAGAVDSRNGYGAMVRGRFSCSMVKTAGDWTVSDGYVV